MAMKIDGIRHCNDMRIQSENNFLDKEGFILRMNLLGFPVIIYFSSIFNKSFDNFLPIYS